MTNWASKVGTLPTQNTSIQSHTEGIGLGELTTRFDIAPTHDENQSIVSWKEGFDGPDIFVNDPNGQRRPPNNSDFKKRPFQASDTGESEGESSVVSVDDLGFSAAPAESLPQFRDFYTRWEKNQGGSKVELFMDVDEIRAHLGDSESSEATVEQLVGVKMEKSFERSKQDSEDYLPRDAFEAIFDIETIKSLIREAYAEGTKQKWEEIVAQIIRNSPSQGYRRILGVLVLMNRVSRIYEFIDERITDYEFPIRRNSSDNKAFETRTGLHNAKLFQNWMRNDIELFYVYQKKLFVPFFDIQEGQLCSYVLDSSVRLPWKDFEQKTSGGNGLVHRVEIHSQHHNFQSSNDPEKPLYFALKEIFTLDRDAYRQELWALEKSTAHVQKENHLIKLLLTFQHGDICYLLFEWADGNLADFWEQPEIMPIPSDLWAVEQFLGISNAIKRIHGLATWQKQRRSSLGSGNDDEREWGRHGDIKPNNILWFSKYKANSNETLYNHLVVSDLGLTRYHSQNTRSAVHKSHLEGCTWGYRPPEMDMEHFISSSYDIWSLGCVFLEFCVWYVNGGDSVQIFGIEREHEDKSEIRNMFEDKYFNTTTDERGIKQAYIKPIVEEYLTTKLRESDRFTPFVEQMLTLIKFRMLVVDPKNRWKIDQVCAELFKMKSEISMMETSLDPTSEPMYHIGATLNVAEQEIYNESRPPVDLDTYRIDELVHHAQGNSGDSLAESECRPTISIFSSGDDPDGIQQSQSTVQDSFTIDGESRQYKTIPSTFSEGTQTTFDVSDSPLLATASQQDAISELRNRSISQFKRGDAEIIQSEVSYVTRIEASERQIDHSGEGKSRSRDNRMNKSRRLIILREKAGQYFRRIMVGLCRLTKMKRKPPIPETT
ncbi:kinase-like domain-containing protein [Annulohypoxylon stygium]|nr:kinase-like domain-containing protein [Annulohypoxylon stygium]